MNIEIYSDEFEDSWIRCRTLSFLYTDYYDDVLKKKPKINGIELICLKDNKVVGLLDIEVNEPSCSYDKSKNGAMIETIAVHPDFQNLGIGTQLLKVAEKLLINENIEYLEAWTREDIVSNKWYKNNGFFRFNHYYHVFTSDYIKSTNKSLNPIFTFAHLNNKNNIDETKVDRLYECNGYVKVFNINDKKGV